MEKVTMLRGSVLLAEVMDTTGETYWVKKSRLRQIDGETILLTERGILSLATKRANQEYAEREEDEAEEFEEVIQ